MVEATKADCYKVTVPATGEQFLCHSNQSILSAAHAADILIPYSCRGGRCGSCRGRILAGQVEYLQGLPEALTQTESAQGYALFCSAYARSDLSLEIMRPAPIEGLG